MSGAGAAWVCCAFIEPETPEQRAAWRAAMPAGRDAVSAIRRPREFARALGAKVAEQAGPQGRTVLVRSAVDRHAFRTAHQSQTVYHGPVVYAGDPDGRLESASSVLELALLRVFMKPSAHRGQHEYRFAVWADGEPDRDRVDRKVSAALLDAMERPPREPERSVVVPASAEVTAVEEVEHPASSGIRVVVEASTAFAVVNHPTIAPPRYRAEDLPADLRETVAVRAAVEALRAAGNQVDGRPRRGAAAVAWHAESVVRFFCSTYGGSIAGVRVNEEGYIVITADVFGDEPVEATVAVGPDGTCACKVSTAGGHRASAAPDVRAFEQVLTSRLAEAGVRGHTAGAAGEQPGEARSDSYGSVVDGCAVEISAEADAVEHADIDHRTRADIRISSGHAIAFEIRPDALPAVAVQESPIDGPRLIGDSIKQTGLYILEIDPASIGLRILVNRPAQDVASRAVPVNVLFSHCLRLVSDGVRDGAEFGRA